VTQSPGSGFHLRALFPSDAARHAEFYELRLRPLAHEQATAHPPGTTENLVVACGGAEITVDGESYVLGEGDALYFDSDVPHAYRNPSSSDTTLLYLVLTFPAS